MLEHDLFRKPVPTFRDHAHAASRIFDFCSAVHTAWGVAGIGNSSVAHELQKVLVRSNGLFASGKYDRYKRDIPYAILAQAFQSLVREILGNPYRPTKFDKSWRTGTAVSLARQMYESREFSAMPILADALQAAGCDNEDILTHCRGPGPHVRGCWVVDMVLGKA